MMKMMSLALKEAGDSFLVRSITVVLTNNGHSPISKARLLVWTILTKHPRS